MSILFLGIFMFCVPFFLFRYLREAFGWSALGPLPDEEVAFDAAHSKYPKIEDIRRKYLREKYLGE